MTDSISRRRVLAGALALGVGGLSLSAANDLLEDFAPLSGDAWEAADRTLSESVTSPYGEANVTTDNHGVPHIEADGEEAAYFAVGYVQGFDRLFQLDLQRRSMRGRLSEVVGEDLLEGDEFHVSMDFLGAAEATWDELEDTTAGTMLSAYADGVNAAMEREDLPLEFRLLDYAPREWTPVDSLLMDKQIAWDLTGNFDELRRAIIADRLGEDVVEELFPDRMDHETPIIRGEDDVGIASSNDTTSGGLRSAGASVTEWLSRFESPTGVGSNSWVVSGEHTSSGTPIVANDPHLALMTPALWYEQHIETPEASIRGVTFPGIPFVIIGANATGAWGFTNVGADVLDCYEYEINEDGDRYRYEGEWREFETQQRNIPVAGGEDRARTIRKTIHGPVIEREGETVGVAWTGLSATRTAEAIYDLGRSDGVAQALEAFELFDAPTQNAVYADADGRTLYAMTGRLPIRRIDAEVVDGNRLFDGSAGEGEWDGYTPYGESSWDGFVPFEEKPHVVDPDVLATANQRVLDDPDHYVGTAYADPYRGRRIYDVLDERVDDGEPIDPEDHRDLQRDTVDGRASQLVPELSASVNSADSDATLSDELVEAAELLENWEYRMDRESEGALVFARWLDHFASVVFEPQFGDADLDESYYPSDWILATLPEDSEFFAETSRGRAMVDALEAALEEIDDAGWEIYGDWNTTRAIEHPLGVEAGFLNYEELAADGSSATVKNYRVESAVGSGWRMVVEPGGEATGIIAGGNSGDFFSPHYDDQFEPWVNGEYKPMDRTIEGDRELEFVEGST
ncbi:penicillin acylase family protein [Halostagnicola sp. A-GB9-2]|uniref:penicillin acylase family protein n=1 Tax=Halostagnicola sp. A-GB9-2 TaxID=3048066 RepID=UPI0024BFED20|nr:penicillin acylase family protein [Halostagnicola sp. A-GB9-2]MDJ1430473.1 penicillin acylase family protein [Halostagnicola sp. A-GB9-2]